MLLKHFKNMASFGWAQWPPRLNLQLLHLRPVIFSAALVKTLLMNINIPPVPNYLYFVSGSGLLCFHDLAAVKALHPPPVTVRVLHFYISHIIAAAFARDKAVLTVWIRLDDF
jgi:hypothetical protein